MHDDLSPQHVFPPINRGIGSDFWLQMDVGNGGKNKNKFGQSRNIHLVGSGRQAIYWVFSSVLVKASDEVLLPAYLDDAVLNSVLACKVKIRFYRLKKDLSIDSDDVIRKCNINTRAVLVIDYFGWNQPISELKSKLKNILLIEDISHSWLNQGEWTWKKSPADLLIGSLRKMLPLGEGGVVINSSGKAKLSKLRSESKNSRLGHRNTRKAMMLLEEYMRTGEKRQKKQARSLFNREESRLFETLSRPIQMSKQTYKLLQSYNLLEIVKCRRQNYLYLMKRVAVWVTPLRSELPKGICPLGLVVNAPKRDQLRKFLIKNNIYPPIHWQLPELITKRDFPLSHQISKHILTLPIDQRYSFFHLDYIFNMIERFYRNEGK